MARASLWIILVLPVAVQTYRYLGESIYYGEYLHWTGVQATRLLILTLAITPLRLTFRRQPFINWLLLRRRDLGLITFTYAVAHALAYFAYREPAQKILEEFSEPGMFTGYAGLLIMLALATTSNNVSVRRLGRRWKRLHRMIYAAAGLTFVHWVLTAFDPTNGYIHLAILVALLALRAWQVRRRPSPH
jgi:sulfoxide reductase heme-binding subunit YedZ